jgi:hypothetical protein
MKWVSIKMKWVSIKMKWVSIKMKWWEWCNSPFVFLKKSGKARLIKKVYL